MARRKGWGQLSPKYRKRLEGAGINRRAYESGAAIKGARGHARTREHAGAQHIKKHGAVVEQYVVEPRVNGLFYRSDIYKAIKNTNPSKEGKYRIAITGYIETAPDNKDQEKYEGARLTLEGPGIEHRKITETTVGQKVLQRDLVDAIEMFRVGPYYVDMEGAMNWILQETPTQFTQVTEFSIATGAPPQGKPR